MAEFVDLGKSCSFIECNRLDFTPFHCRHCNLDFCVLHRFLHGCDESRQYDPSIASSSTALRPYICSLDGCSNAESLKIVCNYCSKNFCLKHRHASDHSCADLPVKVEKTQKTLANIQKIMDNHLGGDVRNKSRSTTDKPVKVLSEAEQKKMDRIELMKLKMKLKDCDLPVEERMFLFVNPPSGNRIAVLVSKKWTVGKCMDHILKTLTLSPNEHTYRLFPPIENAPCFDSSLAASKVFQDSDNIFLRVV